MEYFFIRPKVCPECDFFVWFVYKFTNRVDHRILRKILALPGLFSLFKKVFSNFENLFSCCSVRRSFIKNDNPSGYLPWVALLFCKIKIFFSFPRYHTCVYPSVYTNPKFPHSTIWLTQQIMGLVEKRMEIRLEGCFLTEKRPNMKFGKQNF